MMTVRTSRETGHLCHSHDKLHLRITFSLRFRLKNASDQQTRKAWKRVLTSSDIVQSGCTSAASPPTLCGTGHSLGEGEGSRASPLHPTFAVCDSMLGGKRSHMLQSIISFPDLQYWGSGNETKQSIMSGVKVAPRYKIYVVMVACMRL